MQSFPEVRALMAKYGETQETMGNVIGNVYQTFGAKLRELQDFTYSDMVKIHGYFISKGEVISMEKLFFEWKLTLVNKST